MDGVNYSLFWFFKNLKMYNQPTKNYGLVD